MLGYFSSSAKKNREQQESIAKSIAIRTRKNKWQIDDKAKWNVYAHIEPRTSERKRERGGNERDFDEYT